MILFDGTHLTSDTSIEELREFAASVGLKREWEQVSNKGVIHYDVWGFRAGQIGVAVGRVSKRIVALRGIREWR